MSTSQIPPEASNGMPPEGQHVLLIDDDERFRQRLSSALTDRGVQVASAASRAEAVSVASTLQPWGIVTDLRMPGVTGLELVSELLQLCPESRLLVLTGYGSIASAVEAIRLGAKDYLVKPCNADQVLTALCREASPAPEEVLTQHTPSLARLEHEHIERVLVECSNNVSKAARVLGIHRRTLQYKLSKFPSLR